MWSPLGSVGYHGTFSTLFKLSGMNSTGKSQSHTWETTSSSELLTLKFLLTVRYIYHVEQNNYLLNSMINRNCRVAPSWAWKWPLSCQNLDRYYNSIKGIPYQGRHTRQARQAWFGPCLDFGFQYALIKNNRSKKIVCLFVLFTSSSSTLRGLVKNLDGNEIKNMNINIYYSTLIFWRSQAFQ